MAVARVAAVAFQGVEVLSVDVQVQMAPGSVGFQIVGLPDKAVGESRERVRAALNALGLALPAKRITMLIETNGGFDYTGADCVGWMREAGFRDAYVERLTGTHSMAVATK